MKLADILSIREKTLDLQNEELFFVTFNCFWGVSDVVEQFLMKNQIPSCRENHIYPNLRRFFGGGRQTIGRYIRKKIPAETRHLSTGHGYKLFDLTLHSGYERAKGQAEKRGRESEPNYPGSRAYIQKQFFNTTFLAYGA